MESFDLDQALTLMNVLKAPRRLIKHGQIVSEVAVEIVHFCQSLGVKCNLQVVQIGALLHDIGKVAFPEELTESGSKHEQVGELLLLAHGVPASIAAICRTHGQWDQAASIEEIIVATADNIWSGVRHQGIEFYLAFMIAAELGFEVWHAFIEVDSRLTDIAANSIARLADAQ